jgi:PTS system N-acetylglucosamine-specific IIC component
MKSPLEFLQPLGRALMLPIAVLPAAGLLLRLGQPDLLNQPFVAAAGAALFANLGILFAIGVAVGFAKENHGAAGLAGVVCYLISVRGAQALLSVPPSVLAGLPASAADLAVAAFKEKATDGLMVPIGIVSGLVGGLFYNRFSTFKLPDYLAFFGGRRFVPIISGFAGLLIAAVVGLGYGAIKHGVDALSFAILSSGDIGLFVYGLLNRLLIVTGLHHILNNVVWFVIGDYHGATGDLNRFAAGDPSAGAFMAGYFPIMMFGLPAACLAMYHAAPPSRRAAVGGMLLSLALTSFLTGVTEPIEFSFMFLAPVLFALHAVLTGAAMVVMDLLKVKLGFGFSAGLFDYVLNFNKATRPLLLLPVGALTFAVYYGLFRIAIQRFDLKTPGRDAEPAVASSAEPATASSRGEAFAAALGGGANLVVIDACTTRLRLIIADASKIDEARLKTLGARGFVKPSEKAFQVVLGPIADDVASEIRAAVASEGRTPVASVDQAAVAAAPRSPEPKARPLSAESLSRAQALLAALGGEANVLGVEARASRLRLDLNDAAVIDADLLKRIGVRAIAPINPRCLHLVMGPNADTDGAALAAILPKP